MQHRALRRAVLRLVDSAGAVVVSAAVEALAAAAEGEVAAVVLAEAADRADEAGAARAAMAHSLVIAAMRDARRCADRSFIPSAIPR